MFSINGAQADEASLTPGDQLRIGDTAIEVVSLDAPPRLAARRRSATRSDEKLADFDARLERLSRLTSRLDGAARHGRALVKRLERGQTCRPVPAGDPDETLRYPPNEAGSRAALADATLAIEASLRTAFIDPMAERLDQAARMLDEAAARVENERRSIDRLCQDFDERRRALDEEHGQFLEQLRRREERLAAEQLALDRRFSDLDEREREVEADRAAWETLHAEHQAATLGERKNYETLARQLATEREALAEEHMRLDDLRREDAAAQVERSRRLESEHAELHRRAEELDDRRRELETRVAELAARETRLSIEAADLASRTSEREAWLARRESELTAAHATAEATRLAWEAECHARRDDLANLKDECVAELCREFDRVSRHMAASLAQAAESGERDRLTALCDERQKLAKTADDLELTIEGRLAELIGRERELIGLRTDLVAERLAWHTEKAAEQAALDERWEELKARQAQMAEEERLAGERTSAELARLEADMAALSAQRAEWLAEQERSVGILATARETCDANFERSRAEFGRLEAEAAKLAESLATLAHREVTIADALARLTIDRAQAATEYSRQLAECEEAKAELDTRRFEAEQAVAKSAAQLERRANELDEAHLALEGERRELQASRSEVEAASRLLRADQSRLEAGLTAIDADRQALAAEQASSREERQRLEAELARLSVDRAALAEEMRAFEQQSSHLSAEQRALSITQADLAASQERLTAERAEFDSDRANLANEAARLATERQALESVPAELDARRDELRVAREALAEDRARLDADRDNWLVERAVEADERAKRGAEFDRRAADLHRQACEFETTHGLAIERETHDREELASLRAQAEELRAALDAERRQMAEERDAMEIQLATTRRELDARSHELDLRRVELEHLSQELESRQAAFAESTTATGEHEAIPSESRVTSDAAGATDLETEADQDARLDRLLGGLRMLPLKQPARLENHDDKSNSPESEVQYSTDSQEAPVSAAALLERLGQSVPTDDEPNPCSLSRPSLMPAPLAARPPFASEPARHDGEEDHQGAVDEYMARLFQRLGGAAPQRPTEESAPVRATTRPIEASRVPVTVERGEAEQEAQPKAPRGGPAPERSLDMSALREVAVSNARTAIGQHQRQRVSKQLASQGGLLIALALTAVGMGWLWWANIVPWAIYGLAATSGLVLAFAAHVIMLMIGMRPAEEGMGRPSIETNRDVSPSDVAEDIVADEISISEKPSGEPMVSPATRAE